MRESHVAVREGARPSCQSVKGRRVRVRMLGREREAGRARLLGILNANRKIRKRTDTDVAFTWEYSRVSIFHRERECTN